MKKTQWLVIVLILACVLTLSACKKDTVQQQNPNTEQSTNQPSDNNETTDTDNTQTPSADNIECQHTFGDWATQKQATCSEEGELVRSCSKCSHSEKTTIAKNNVHVEVINSAVAATCTETGLTEGKHCSRCGAILIVQTTVDTLGHIEVIDSAVEATCAETGLTQGKHCSRCSEVIVAQRELPTLLHEYVDGFCKNCSAYDEIVKSEELAREALRHKIAVEQIIDQNNWLISITQERINSLKSVHNISYVYDNLTCYQKKRELESEISELESEISYLEFMYGDDVSYRSKIANLKREKQSLETELEKYKAMIDIIYWEDVIISYMEDYEENIDAENNLYETNKELINAKYSQESFVCKDHQWNEWKILTEVSCLEIGLKTRYCQKCALVDNDVTEKLEHVIVVDEYIPATCTKTGLTEGKHCSVCDTVFIATEIISATGHNYSEWLRVLNPTCTDVGQEERTCFTCGFKDYQTVATIAHNYTDNWCTVCNQVDPSSVISILKNYIMSNGTETSKDNYCILLGTTQEEDFTYERKNYYNASTDTIKLAIDVYYFGQYQWTVSIEMTSVQASYSWRWDDIGNGKMIGTFTASTFNGNMSYMPYTWTNITSLADDIKSMSVYYLDHLIFMMKEDYKDIGLQAKNFGFSKY